MHERRNHLTVVGLAVLVLRQEPGAPLEGCGFLAAVAVITVGKREGDVALIVDNDLDTLGESAIYRFLGIGFVDGEHQHMGVGVEVVRYQWDLVVFIAVV